jgi:hypothetical protein
VAGRLFNEKEVSEILKIASSTRSRADGGDPAGITLEELQQVGTELGFDPHHIELAAQQLGPRSSSRKTPFNPRVVLDRTVDGEMSQNDWLGMVAAIQRFYKSSGAVTQRPNSFDWAGSEEGGSLAVTVKVSHGRSRIVVESNRWVGLMMIGLFGAALTLAFSLSLIRHGRAAETVPVCLLMATIMTFAAHHLRQNHLQSASRLMKRLSDEVQPTNDVRQTETATSVALPATTEQRLTT